MASLLSAPLLPITYLRPNRASFDEVGGAIEGGANLLGESITMAFSGGGHVTATYERCMLEADDTERHEVINWIGARGNGGFRYFAVPIINDGIGPFPTIAGARRAIIKGIPHSDGALFSDGSGYSQATVWAKLLEGASLNAGQVKIRVYGAARDLRWSDWLSIFHNQNGLASKGWRAWRYWEVDKLDEGTETIEGAPLAYRDFRLAITPPLREATAAETRIEVARPTCVMRFPRGFTLPWDYEGDYSSRPTLQFVEAF